MLRRRSSTGDMSRARARRSIDALDGVVAQRSPAAADEAAGHGVGVDELRVHVHRGHDVGGEHVGDDDVGLAGSRTRVGAEVVEQLAAYAAQLALSVRRDLDLDHGAMALRRGRAVLAARGDPLRRPLQAPRGECGEDLLGKRAALGAETAADILGERRAPSLPRGRAPRRSPPALRTRSASRSRP